MPMTRTLVLLLAAALALSACGRKGALEAPGTVAPVAAAPTVFGTIAPDKPAAQPVQPDEPFILDGII